MTTETEEQSIQDVVREAAEAEASKVDSVEATVEETTNAEDTETVSNRDENGRFKPKETATNEPAAQTTETEQNTWSPERPPSSWTPKAREKWADLPLEIRQEITRREENAFSGARKLQEQYAPVRQFVEHFDPIFKDLGSAGINPQQHIATVLGTERVLRTADLPTRFDALLGIADQYSIPLRDIINQSVGQQVLRSPQQAQIPDSIARELGEIRQWRNQQEQAVVNSEVASFGQGQEFFNDVRHHMADLIERGVCPDLQTAYETATWSNPEIRSILIDRQTKGTVTAQVATRQSKAVGTGIKPSNTVEVDHDNSDDTIADTVRKAWTQSNGRI